MKGLDRAMHNRISLARIAGLTLGLLAACGGRLADDPSASGVDASIDSPPPAPLTCTAESDCAGQCDGSSACCCDVGAGVCYSPSSGQCASSAPGSSEEDSGFRPPI
jgi:hypothetical protein